VLEPETKTWMPAFAGMTRPHFASRREQPERLEPLARLERSTAVERLERPRLYLSAANLILNFKP
jgi:hypothetical protein